jgi:AraC-like DNA-binding protein
VAVNVSGDTRVAECNQIFNLTSSQASVLRDEVAARTTPHEVLTKESSLQGKVGMITMPSSRFVFVRYGGNVVVEAPPTNDRIVATIPLGPMGVSHRNHVKPTNFTSGFILSPNNVTVMRPDPWAGALIIASDAEQLNNQRRKVLGESNTSTITFAEDSNVGSRWLTHTCRSLWELASTIPSETPVQVMEKFLGVMEDNLLNALIMATEDPQALGAVESSRARNIQNWIEAHYQEPLTVADLAAAVGLSVRHLQVSVQEHFSVGPMELLRDIRLSKLHSLLRSSDADQSTVATLAYSVGFTHLGRTSQFYREKYDECPSRTLKRSMHE